jgi:hypothetical protein
MSAYALLDTCTILDMLVVPMPWLRWEKLELRASSPLMVSGSFLLLYAQLFVQSFLVAWYIDFR